MSKTSSFDTIFALATAPGRAGVAVLRLSGSRAGEISQMLIRSALPKPRYAHFTKFFHPADNSLIDEGLFLWMPAPHSFTGEDVAEFQIHGGAAIIEAFTGFFLSLSHCRHAQAGEFSRRAFLNGKKDLTEIEAISDLVDAQTSHQHRQALRQMQGELGALYTQWHASLKKSLAYMEAFLDFPDEDLPEEINPEIYNQIDTLTMQIESHLSDHHIGERIREGFYISILGLPNAGKSSLLNAITQREAAIVTDVAGTTRDIIEVDLNLDGYPVTLVDTAGLRETADLVESLGIQKAIEKAEASDLQIILLEAKSLGDFKHDLNLLQNQINPSESTIWVVNKTDLIDEDQYKKISKLLPQSAPILSLSLKNKSGLKEFKSALIAFLKAQFSIPETPLITRQRHRAHIENSLMALKRFHKAPAQELAAEELRTAMYHLGAITGYVDVEDLLDVIFRDFCIGK